MSSLKDRKSIKTDRADAAEAFLVARPARVVIGQVVRVGTDGAPWVDYPNNPAGGPVAALATARYDDVPSGRSVALMFLDGDPVRPLAIGIVAAPTDAASGSAGVPHGERPGERLMLSATREIVLQCGRASLVLTRAGKVLVRGAYVSLRSSGMQRITGASVQIN